MVAGRAEAAAAGGHLVTITSASENEFIRSNFLGEGGSSIWLGFTDAASEGTFAWVTGEPFVYTNWISGGLLAADEPFDLLGTSDYGAMSSASGGWEDSTNALPSWFSGLIALPSGPPITVIEFDQ
ncbi:MAG: lectin-like protein [Acidimicrobiales bacterium]